MSQLDGSAKGSADDEWSDAELRELGDMLLRGLSIEEIARLLGRDKVEVRYKVAEIGRACHPTAHQRSRARGLSPWEWRVRPLGSLYSDGSRAAVWKPE